ncbi:MAG: Ig-like domain-containing protein, partial [Lachnospiraceae bacterium]|nr:Ig-like domain-containing protein [Lachnospiraceae bacterium]
FASAKPFQAYFESNGKEIHDFKGGKATVSIKFSPESGRDVKHYHMYYLPVAGAIERYVTRYVDGMLSFVTTHFSDYAIVYDETMENETGKEDEADNTDTDDNNGTDDGKTTEETSETTANGKTAYQNALSINKGLKVSQIGNKITISWGKVSGANRYEIYVAYCTGKFGKTPVKVVTKKGVTSVTITKLNGKKLELTKNFKVYVAAYKTVDGVKKKLGKTITAHIVGRKNKTYTNVKAIKLAKNKATIKVGKTYKIKASVVLVDSKKKMLSDKHAATFRYASSDKKIATVDKNGKVIAKKVGTCYIWIYTKNGNAKKVKITVK